MEMTNSKTPEDIIATKLDSPSNNIPRLVTKRDLPAYLEYASDILASINYRLMSLSERGLWDTMRKECWVNGKVPSNLDDLAQILNLPVDVVKSNLTDRVVSFFLQRDGFFTCPELDNYKALKLNSRDAMAEGGARGGRKTQNDIREAKGTLKVGHKPLNRTELSRREWKRKESPRTVDLSPEHQEWIDDYDGKK